MQPIIKSGKREFGKIKLILSFLIPILALLLFYILSKFYNKPFKSYSPVFSTEVASPIFSTPPGFYNKSFLLKIQAPVANAEIYYTTDNSKPTFNSNKYTNPVLIESRADEPNKLSEIKNSPVYFYPLEKVFKGTVIRAIALVNDSVYGEEAVGTFFIHPEGRNRYSLPVFSLVTEDDNFFGYKDGIYVNGATTDDKDYYIKNNIRIDDNKLGFPANFKRRGDKWERPVNLEFFEENSNKGFSIKAGVKIHGNATRERPQKSLKVFTTGTYGSGVLNYPLFYQQGTSQFYSFLLRNSGQDMYLTMFRDAFMQSLIFDNTSVDLQRYQPSILFINGEYWGIHNIRERIDEFYFLNKYNIPLDSLDILGPRYNVDYGDSLAKQDFTKLLAFIHDNDMALSSNYSIVESQIEIDDMIDYVIFETYFANKDWPHNNFNVWRYTNPLKATGVKDGKWRFALYDTDYGFGAETNASVNMLSFFFKTSFGSNFYKLLENQSFKKKFLNRYLYHLDTTFNTDRTIRLIDMMEDNLNNEMLEHIDRWRTINSIVQWQKNVDILRNFAENRPAHVKKELSKFTK